MMDDSNTEREHLLGQSAAEAHELSSLGPSKEQRDQPDAPEQSNKSRNDTNRKLLGCVLSLISTLIMTIGVAEVQLLNHTVPQSELNGLRFSVSLMICVGYLAISRNHKIIHVPKSEYGWVIITALSCALATYANFGKASYLPLGIATGTNLSLEVVLNNVVSCVIQKVVHWNEVLASILCILGVCLTTQPAFLFHHIGPSIIDSNITIEIPCSSKHDLETISLMNNQTDAVDGMSLSESEQATHETIIGYILCLVEAVATVAYINLVRYRLSDLNVVSLSFWVSVVGVVSSFALMAAVDVPAFPDAPLCVLVLVTQTLSVGCRTFLYTYTAQLISPVWMVLFDMLKIPFLFVLQYTILAALYPGHGNMVEILGALIILIANTIIPITESSVCRRERS